MKPVYFIWHFYYNLGLIDNLVVIYRLAGCEILNYGANPRQLVECY